MQLYNLKFECDQFFEWYHSTIVFELYHKSTHLNCITNQLNRIVSQINSFELYQSIDSAEVSHCKHSFEMYQSI